MELNTPTNQFSATTRLAAPKKYGIFEVILLLIVGILFYWFIVSPKQGDLKKQDDQFQQLQQQEVKLEESKTQLLGALNDLRLHPQEVSELDEALPLDNRVTKLYIALTDITNQSGMTVGNINVSYGGTAPMAGDKALLTSPYTAKRSLQKLTTSLNVTGSFDQFMSLLDKLQNSGRVINVTALNITPDKSGMYAFMVNLESYYYFGQ